MKTTQLGLDKSLVARTSNTGQHGRDLIAVARRHQHEQEESFGNAVTRSRISNQPGTQISVHSGANQRSMQTAS